MLSSSPLQFVVYGNAQPAGSKTAGVTKAGRVYVRDASRGAREWKQAVARAAAEAMNGAPLLDGPLDVTLMFFAPRPRGHYGKKGLLPSAPVHVTVRPDLLKLARAVEDALTGIVYRDDAQIVTETLSKRYDEQSCVLVKVDVLTNRPSGVRTPSRGVTRPRTR